MLKKVKDWIGPSLDVYKVENANDVGVGLCRHIWQGEKGATQIGTTLNAEIMNNLQNSLVHTITATKNAGSGVDYYVCNLDGLNEFGLNKDLKLRINVDYENTNTTTKLRLNNNDYTLLKEDNGNLKQIEAGDIHRNKTYELIYNGSQFVIINLFKNFESAYLDNYVKTTDLAQENKAGIVTLNKIKGLIPAATNDTNGTINLRQINDMIDMKVPNASNNTNGTVNLRQINDMIDIRVPSATNNIAGKVMLGTTRNTALEGSRLGEILGLEFGGNIQDSGSKIKGKFYYDSVTKFYYECLENTNLTYNDSGKFRAISNKPLSDKVENLSIIKVSKTSLSGNYTTNVISRTGNLCILNIDSNDTLYNKKYGDILFTIPAGFRPKKYISASASCLNSNECVALRIHPDGNVVLYSQKQINTALYINATYFID